MYLLMFLDWHYILAIAGILATIFIGYIQSRLKKRKNKRRHQHSPFSSNSRSVRVESTSEYTESNTNIIINNPIFLFDIGKGRSREEDYKQTLITILKQCWIDDSKEKRLP